VAGAHPELVVWLLLVPVGLTLALVDLRVFRLPDVLTLPALGGTAALLGGAALLPSHDGSWVRALLGAAVLGVLYMVLFLINPAGMGFGDVKLAPTLGLALGWYGWPALVQGTLAAFLLGALAGLALLLTGRAHRKTPIPFGPFMLAGSAVALLLT
jgi:leader peptidase (prepilin peptidase)/N-methyltransferase